jgi:hypothetical protein
MSGHRRGSVEEGAGSDLGFVIEGEATWLFLIALGL